MPSDAYATNHSWVRTVGRPDAIDEVADQFERPTPTAVLAPPRTRMVHWPQHSRGWRSIARLHPVLRETA